MYHINSCYLNTEDLLCEASKHPKKKLFPINWTHISLLSHEHDDTFFLFPLFCYLIRASKNTHWKLPWNMVMPWNLLNNCLFAHTHTHTHTYTQHEELFLSHILKFTVNHCPGGETMWTWNNETVQQYTAVERSLQCSRAKWAQVRNTPDVKNWFNGKDPDAWKHWWQEEKGKTENEMVSWHHWLDGCEFEQVLGVGDRQGSLECCSPWGCKELDTTEWLNWTEEMLRR